MRAIRLHAFGPAENLSPEQLPDPEPGPGQVRIAVAAAGVHVIDTHLRAGDAGSSPLPLPELPTVPGREVAGTVDAVGPGVDPSWRGLRVTAHLGTVPGGYASLAVTGADRLHVLPDTVGFPEAVAMIGTGRTATGILRLAELSAADTVVVTSAAGGIGALAVQYAAGLGARVVGLAGGPEKASLVAELGATLAVDHRDPSWPQTVRAALGAEQPATVLLDGRGGAAAVPLLAPGARHLRYAGGPAGTRTDVTTLNLLGPTLTSGTTLRALETTALARVADGTWRPLLTTYPLDEAARAHADLENRRTTGKVVLLP